MNRKVPTFPLIFDTHCHLSDKIYREDSLEKIIRESRDVGVSFILNVGYNMETNHRVIEQMNFFQNANVFSSLGIHPNDYKDRKSENLLWMEKMIKEYSRKIVAVGEIGLDYYRAKNEEETKAQKIWFLKQLKLAKKYDLPVLLHIRDAFKDAYEIVLKAGNKEGLVHCFSGSEEDAKNFLSIGFYVSFAGNITYKKGKELIEIEKIIRMIPDDKLLIETDSPYLSPYPRRGEVNFPKNITFTLEKISEIRKINYFLLSKKMTQNSLNLFNIKTKI